MPSAKEKFENAVVNLISDKTYLIGLSHVIIKLPVRNLPDMSTMCVTFNKSNYYMFYDEDFVESLDFEELKAVILHEFMHLMLNHMHRYKKYYDAGINGKILNISCDAAINQYLKNMPTWAIYPTSFGAPEGYTFEQYTEYILDKFYDNVKKLTQKRNQKGGNNSNNGEDEEEDNGKGNAQGSSGGQQQDENGSNGNDEKLTDETKGGLLDNLFDGKKNGSHELWKNITEDEAETAKEMLRATVMEAAGKMAGSVPGGLIQEIEAAWEEVINWKAALRYFYQSVIANYNVYSRTVRDRRRGLDVPGPKKGYSCRLLFCIDTSGSMSDNDLAHVISECRHLGKILKIDADVLQFDYGLQDFCEINKFVAAKKFKGRGGTSFQPPFDFAQNKKFRVESLTKMGKTPKTKKYDGVVIYTDGYAEKPRLDIPLKILWLMTPGNKKTSDWPGREVEVKIPKGK